MGKDPAISWFLLLMFGLSWASGFAQFAATARLAKWLFHHHPKIWRELGRLGTTFFKGESDNGYFSRTSALQWMNKIMPLHDYRRKLAKDDAAQRYLRQHEVAGRWSAICLGLFIIGIFCGVIRDKQRRSTSSPPSTETNSQQDNGHQATKR
jgi:hypothetical protein